MKRLLLGALASLTMLPLAHAHTKLTASMPAADSAVAAPKEIALEFGGDVRLTAVTLTDASGAEKPLDPVPTEIASKFALAVRAPLASGEYVVVWRAVGGDTHIVSGEVRFTVKAAEAL